MIVFDLLCSAGHRFEGWFGSPDDFGAQVRRGLLSCPKCGSASVERVPSATRMIGARSVAPEQKAPQARPDLKLAGKDPLAIAQMRYSRLVDEILTKTEDVGREFPVEARRIHYEEAPARAIRGVASQAEHDALLDEGIPVARLPLPPGRPN